MPVQTSFGVSRLRCKTSGLSAAVLRIGGRVPTPGTEDSVGGGSHADRSADHASAFVPKNGACRSNDSKKKSFGRANNDFPAMFSNGSGSLPLADHAARGVGSDIRGICQLFVGHIEFNTARDFLADAGRQLQKHMGEPLLSSLRG